MTIARGPGWELRCSDCLGPDGIGSLPDGSIDHVITDPPYGAHIYAEYDGTSTQKQRLFGRNNDMEKMASWEGIDGSIDPLCEQFFRVSRRWVVVFSDEETGFLWRRGMAGGFI